MGTNIGKTFLKGNLAKDIKSLQTYLSFNLATPLLRMYSMEIILNMPKGFSNKVFTTVDVYNVKKLLVHNK